MSRPEIVSAREGEPFRRIAQVKNISGAALSAGDAVMWTVASTADHEVGVTVVLATVAGEDRFAGTVIGKTLDAAEDDIQDDGYGYIVVGGVSTNVTVEAAVAEGDDLSVAATDGQLVTTGAAGAGVNVVGEALDASASGTLGEAFLSGLS